MLPIKRRRQDPATLIWEYLDGDISPSRAQALSDMLAERSQVRDQMVESAVLHGMLIEYYRKDAVAEGSAQPRKRRRSSAA